MEASTAGALIEDGQKLVHARHAGGPYFLCANAWGLGIENTVPSWVWRKEAVAHRVHYLDLPLLETCVFNAGYVLKYDKPEVLKQLKDSYMERRLWKRSDDPEVMEQIQGIWAAKGKPMPVLSAPSFRQLDAKQLAGARFAFRAGRVLIADGPGCISGDAEIIVNRGGNARRYTLKEAYIGFNGIDKSGNHGWRLPSYTRSLDGDIFRLNKIIGIVNKGVRRVLKITTESGKTITATPDHVFFTPTGEHQIGSMKVGEHLYTNGVPVCNMCGKPGDIVSYKYARFPGSCKTCVYRRLRENGETATVKMGNGGYVMITAGVRYHPSGNKRIPEHRLVYEASLNGMSYDSFMARLRTGDISNLRFLPKTEVVHHKDEVKTNNAPSNLELLTTGKHAEEHSHANTRKLWNVKGPKSDRIVSIEDAGEQEVFDLMMERPFHSFIANGFVVHNCGKTSEALYAVLLNKANSRPYKTLVICPTSVKGSWIDDAEALGGLHVLTLSGNMEERVAQYDLIEKADLVVCSQGSFIDDYAELARYGFNIIILDEGHSIGNRDNKLTQVLIGGRKIRKTFCQMVKPHSIYILTGTPLSNKLDDLYPLLKLMDPGVLSWGGFLNRYTTREEKVRWMTGPNGRYPKKFMAVTGYVNHAELKAKLSLHMIRRTKDQALPDLPKKRFRTVDIEFSATERKVYEDLKETFVAVIGGKEIAVKSKLEWMTKAAQICNSLEIVKGSGSNESSKLKEMLRWVEKIAPHHKIVIFSRSKEMTSIIVRECAKWNPIHFHGEIPDKKRPALIAAFQKEKKHRLFVSTRAAGGVGVTLTAGNICILFDRHWAPGGNTQAADRCHRRTQTRPVLVLSFRVKDSFEEKIEKCWLAKQQMVSDMVGDEEVLDSMTNTELMDIL